MGLSFHDEGSMVEANIGSLRFSPNIPNSISETGEINIVDEERRNDDVEILLIDDSDIQMVDRWIVERKEHHIMFISSKSVLGSLVTLDLIIGIQNMLNAIITPTFKLSWSPCRLDCLSTTRLRREFRGGKFTYFPWQSAFNPRNWNERYSEHLTIDDVHKNLNLNFILAGTLVSASYLPWTLFGGVLLQYDIFSKYHQGIMAVFMWKSEQQKQANGMIPSQTWSIPTNSSESRTYSEEYPRHPWQETVCGHHAHKSAHVSII